MALLVHQVSSVMYFSYKSETWETEEARKHLIYYRNITTWILCRWCFDVELVYLSKRLKIPMIEVSVNWSEIPGSKVRLTSIMHMLFELVLIRLGYGLGMWKIHTWKGFASASNHDKVHIICFCGKLRVAFRRKWTDNSLAEVQFFIGAVFKSCGCILSKSYCCWQCSSHDHDASWGEPSLLTL